MKEMDHRQRLVNYVDPGDLSQNERETGIQFFGDADRFQIITYVPTLVKSTLKHENAEIKWCYLEDNSERKRREENIMEIEPTKDNVKIEGICAKYPIGCMTIKGISRSEDYISQIISTPKDVEAAREAFDS